jgi:hypothetical protein
MSQLEPVTLFGRTLPALYEVRAGGLPLGPVGLAAGAALGAWLEWLVLRQRLRAQVGRVVPGAALLTKLFGAGVLAALVGRAAAAPLAGSPLPAALVGASVYGMTYLGAAWLLRVSEVRALASAVRRRLR